MAKSTDETQDTETTEAPASVDSELQARWEAFLARAEKDRIATGTHHIFLAQKEAGEFDKIPQSFLQPQGIRVAPK